MSLDLVLNELSLLAVAKDRYTARKWMESLIDTVVAVGKTSNIVLRTKDSFYTTGLAQDGYTGGDWAYDPEVDEEARLLFLTMTTQTPFWAEVDDQDIREASLLSEVEYQGKPVDGFLCAHLLGGIAVSLPSEVQWNTPWVQVQYQSLADDEVMTNGTVSIRHVSVPRHVSVHEDWIRSRLQQGVHNGRDLWRRRGALYQHLKFCDDVEAQLRRLYSGALMDSTMDRLAELDIYSREWTAGPFVRDRIPSKVSSESQPTLDKFSEERTHRCPDGEYRVFKWHVRLTPFAWRVYFYPDEKNKELVIGHIGPKPPTVSDPT